MVAAWMSADTGVGPSIASSSHAWRGSCADLPHAPSSNSRPTAVMTPRPAPSTAPNTGWKATVPKVVNSSMIEISRPMSPTRLIRKAFLAATAAAGLCCQNPISR